MTTTVADSIATTLHAYGVRFAFGLPGNDVLETIRACEAVGITFVLAKAEPSAAFMADAVYQLTGAPAALIPALGPGIANAVSGIAGAAQERSAMIVLSGEMGTKQMGIYTHQIFDHVALCAPVTKYAAPLNPNRPAQQVAKALDIALSHPAGPVMLNAAADHTRAPAPKEPAFTPPRVLPVALPAEAVATARALLEKARRPLALVGRGALKDGVPEPLRRFLEAWSMPFFATYKAKGVLDDAHPLCLGAVGLSPIVDQENQALVAEADLIVPIGFDPIELRDGWVDAWPVDRACLSIDWAPATHRVFPLGTEAAGDLPTILGQLAPEGGGRKTGWPTERLDRLRAAVAHIVRPRTPDHGISPAALFGAISDRADADWIMTVDVGSHRILANHVIRCRAPGQLMQSNGLGCMGYALPAAVGAQLVHPERPVVAIAGDGCTLMTLGEMAVAAERGLPIVLVVLNDASLSLIKLKQSKMGLDTKSVDFGAPRFDAIAAGFGAVGVRVETIGAFAEALDQAVRSRRFTIIDALVDPREYWEQM
ncbi:thiamine pyrophosphate-binding protein [Azospirillum sp. RWY-5-1]|uniref:Thiamine pyrophosphate-binding protein n=1 Tax=Azospirillum oleiclasticum TaxID=2735135 RepID=A0ABX2T9I4_9PROT|nr:thiamine pyrophosphate-binding protein [Azospirillum oleiclasticum]NYZ13920.1 thiamine pyrophosphate-binding protein [Azospirillum oleiclasticum]NYZ20844.1 thiamine pyrophosphate-binding protein [Azospirillum oleiclasticum]